MAFRWVRSGCSREDSLAEGKSGDGATLNLMVNFVRYADDFIITGCSKELLENEVKPLVERFMLERGAMRSPHEKPASRISNRADFTGLGSA